MPAALFAHMASVLRTASPVVPERACGPYPGVPKTEQIRRLLRECGPLSSPDLARRVGLAEGGGLVAALLKNDLHKGRVVRNGELYSWNEAPGDAQQEQIDQAVSLLRRHGYIVKKRAS